MRLLWGNEAQTICIHECRMAQVVSGPRDSKYRNHDANPVQCSRLHLGNDLGRVARAGRVSDTTYFEVNMGRTLGSAVLSVCWLLDRTKSLTPGMDDSHLDKGVERNNYL